MLKFIYLFILKERHRANHGFESGAGIILYFEHFREFQLLPRVLASFVFLGNIFLTGMSLPTSLTYIPEYLCHSCSSLQSLIVPK
jgi:hypothetical protein